MTEMTDLIRRKFLWMPFAALMLALHTHGVLAKDGESGGGSGDNSGSGGSDDDGDDDDEADDDGSSSGGSGHSKDHDRARDAVRRGKAVSLKALKQHLAANYPGKVLKIELKKRSGDLIYKVRILDTKGRLNTLRLDARSLARSKS
jgi:hypothetical protein